MNIGAIARQTGIEVATLRKWESRYGFPKPLRSQTGRREYSAETVDQLLAVRRSIAGGLRPGKAIHALLSRSGLGSAQPETDACSRGISLLLQSDILSFKEWLVARRQQMTASAFVEQIAAPMAREVGVLWANGKLPVFLEHVFSEELQRVLRLAHAQDRTSRWQPRVLLTAPAGEKHTMGLLMAGAVLAAHGEEAIYLTADLPIPEIVAAATHYRVAAVGLTTSTSYPSKLLLACLQALRHALPAPMQLWVGGAGVIRLPKLPENIVQISSMSDLQTCLKTLPDDANAFPGKQLS